LNVEANPNHRWSRRTHVIIGAVAGAALGAATIYRDATCGPDGPCRFFRFELYYVVPLTVGAGSLGGMIVGAVWPAAHWERVSADSTR
jgi:hypothetical protein